MAILEARHVHLGARLHGTGIGIAYLGQRLGACRGPLLVPQPAALTLVHRGFCLPMSGLLTQPLPRMYRRANSERFPCVVPGGHVNMLPNAAAVRKTGWRKMSWEWVGTAGALGAASIFFAWAIFNSPGRHADDELEVRELSAMQAAKNGKLSRLKRPPKFRES